MRENYHLHILKIDPLFFVCYCDLTLNNLASNAPSEGVNTCR
jgi:hypothetical protein